MQSTPDDPTNTPLAHRQPPGFVRTVIAASIFVALAITLHSVVPRSLGTLNATLLPWLGWLVAALAISAVLTRHRTTMLIAALPALAWLVIVLPTALPLDTSEPEAGTPIVETLTVATQNVQGSASAAAESARALAEEGADVIALVELAGDAREAASEELATSHPFSFQVGTVGLWSVYPLDYEQPLELGLGWRRALSADVITSNGEVSVYVVHAASFRPGSQADRDTMLRSLGEIVPTDVSDRLIVMGDFNATAFDPALAPLLNTVSEPRQSTMSWGFTWPAGLPLARIDHIFARGLDAVENRVVTQADSDHRAVITRFKLEHSDVSDAP